MNFKNIADDLKSSIVVFLVAIPLCLGIALASNASLTAGIISGVIGGIIAGIISGSAISVSGPAAGLTVIVAAGITQLGSFEAFAQAVIIAGIIQIILGLIRGGAIGNFVPVAVIKGMLAAIGLILISKQSYYALGLPKGNWNISLINLNVAILSLSSIFIILLWDKFSKKLPKFLQLLPSALIAVIFSIILNKLFSIVPDDQLVNLPANLFNQVNIHYPAFSIDIVKIGFTIAIVASLETLLCIDASDKLDPQNRKTNKNRELIAQGVGNSLSGLLGGLPITAVIVRTSANVSAGAKTKLSAIFHGFWLFTSVYFFSQILNMIPLATLAAVLILVGYKLTKPDFFIAMKKRGNDQLIIFCLTIVMILMTDLLVGIAIGLFVAFAFEIKNMKRKSIQIHENDSEIHLVIHDNISFWHKHKISNAFDKISVNKSIKVTGKKHHKMHVDIKEFLTEIQNDDKHKNKKIIIDID